MRIDKFHIGKGRYNTLSSSRYKDHTYGQNSFHKAEMEEEADTHGSYGVLLFDKRWSAKRNHILKRDQNACVICKHDANLQIHHRQYHFIKELKQFKAPWDYDDHLMITLCDRCHSKGHSKYKVPKVYL